MTFQRFESRLGVIHLYRPTLSMIRMQPGRKKVSMLLNIVKSKINCPKENEKLQNLLKLYSETHQRCENSPKELISYVSFENLPQKSITRTTKVR